ncbi:MAG: pyridoxamine 5'-phosphate oxidase family protein [Clostridiales bacterium]|nr:pyridoxamine 5'-phosphate oxidase family protein [Clostridiales bacterium]
MNPPMRRINQKLSVEETEKILNRATSGVLALSGEENHPYAVPLSFAYEKNTVYFHCAPVGHKLNLIRENSYASFCVIAEDCVQPATFTTHYRSVIAFGRARIVEEKEEKLRALHLLIEKYANGIPGAQQEIDGAFHRVTVVAMDVDEMTGKEARELMEERNKKKP